MWTVMESAAFAAVVALLSAFSIYIVFGYRTKRKLCKSIAFFHPYCNAAGGGERVLWLAVSALQQSCKEHEIVIYCGDIHHTGDEIINKVEDVFQIVVDKRIKFVNLRSHFLLEASRYPIFTLLLQSFGSIIVAVEALWKYHPNIYIDTLGCTFTHLVFKLLARCKVVCYVHYPIVSSDMLQAVTSCNASFNNSRFISNSLVLTRIKIIYYNLFAILYGFVGRMADIIFVNSSWTKNHIIQIWKAPSKTFLLFPPCDVSNFEQLVAANRSNPIIISISQFRPEKNHSLQLHAFKLLLERLSNEQFEECKLVIVGSCRNAEDERRVHELKEMSAKYGIGSKVVFKTNINFGDLLTTVKSAKVGIHTMNNEHFGISVVELMSAGVIVVAHNSGGPKLDIIEDGVTGFLASNAEEYAEAMFKVIKMSSEQLIRMQKLATNSMKRFSDNEFSSLLLQRLNPLLCEKQ